MMDIDFKVTYSLVSKGSPFNTEFVYDNNKVFNVNEPAIEKAFKIISMAGLFIVFYEN